MSSEHPPPAPDGPESSRGCLLLVGVGVALLLVGTGCSYWFWGWTGVLSALGIVLLPVLILLRALFQDLVRTLPIEATLFGIYLVILGALGYWLAGGWGATAGVGLVCVLALALIGWRRRTGRGTAVSKRAPIRRGRKNWWR